MDAVEMERVADRMRRAARLVAEVEALGVEVEPERPLRPERPPRVFIVWGDEPMGEDERQRLARALEPIHEDPEMMVWVYWAAVPDAERAALLDRAAEMPWGSDGMTG